MAARDARATLAFYLKASKITGFIEEHRVVPHRRFRFDIAFPRYMLAVEVHGGHWTGGRHVRGKGFESDLEKKQIAILAGWTVLEFTADDVKRRPGHVIDIITKALDLRRIKCEQKTSPSSPPEPGSPTAPES